MEHSSARSGQALGTPAPDMLADAVKAAARARAMLRADPANADAYRALGAALRRLGDVGAAEAAEMDAIGASVHDPELVRAAKALLANDLAAAEQVLRPRLKQKPTDVAAIRMMAELAARLGRYVDSENLLRRALELAPAFAAARANLATVLYRQNRPADALAVLDELLEQDGRNPAHQNLKAAALGRIGSYEEAIKTYEDVLERFPGQAKVWMSYGHMLKTVGRQGDSIAAYRRALGIAPSLGEVWWSLANLKTIRFDEADLEAMKRALAQADVTEEDRFHLHFALGKALEDRFEAEGSYHHYAEGNRLRRALIDYDPDEISNHVARSKRLFTRGFFEERRGVGSNAPDPIFILGMPRAGSTLLEQILASHPMVEGTMELPDIPAMAKRIGGRKLRRDETAYPEAVGEFSADDLRELGEEYLERTRVQRKSERPFFIDKMPNNWAHVGFIHLMLPNAKIIDARRHPLACCFSNFKQHFARGQGFTYSQVELGRYYRDYVDLMRHFDDVLPGRIHRVIYEEMVERPEGTVRMLLDHLGLPFDAACLRFYENERAVRTASSEQVRRPIHREGVDQWRAFEPWLEPLKSELGDVLNNYPALP